jgi:hypothetical protein
MIPLKMPVGSPPSEIADGRTCPKPATDGPTRAHAAAIPSVGADAGAAEVVVVVPRTVVDVVEPVSWCRGGTRTVVVVTFVLADGDGELEHAAPMTPATANPATTANDLRLRP